MATKRHKPDEIVSKLRQVDVLVGQGMARVDAIRQVNEQLRKAVADLTIDKQILAEAARGNF